MHIVVSLVALAVSVIAITAVSERYEVPTPLILIVAGIGASFLPFVPEVHLEPEVVLLGLLPPLLYAAAIQTSLVEFRANRRAILLLSVGLVAFTTVGIGVLVHATLPGVDWPASLAIGAVVAPPDAVAATAIGKRIGLPRRVVTILEGESLLNDATALVALRTAIVGSTAVWSIGLDFVLAAGGGVVVGLLGYLLVSQVRRRMTDELLQSALSFVVPFAAYVAAEEIRGSGVIAVVVSGLLLGHKAPVIQHASARVTERMNWRTIAFILENTVFLLIGLQARWILVGVASSDVGLGRVAFVCGASLLGVMVLRMVWVFPARFLLVRPGPDAATRVRPPWSYTAVLGWAGMRGVVTLAAAFVIPYDVPQREILLLIAFTVTAGTLLIQGLSLAWVARRLGVPAPDPRDDALARATLFQKASQAGIAALEELEEADPHDTLSALRDRAEQRDHAAWERLGNDDPGTETPSEAYGRLRLKMLRAERDKVLEVRSTGNVPADVVAEVLAALDIEESMIQGAQRVHRLDREASLSDSGVRVPLCEHLDEMPAQEPIAATECPSCVEEGTRWVHLRRCLTCDRIGCCDSSTERHASAHFRETGHPVMQSAEPQETWRWCFVDERTG